ncbi:MULTISPECIES: hypothetical protein [unclassified Streptomyces]|uniref:hypothetical protein n=1 Tax=unclassified Streptomyces TaxID=2593676 RepID=UPI00382D6924
MATFALVLGSLGPATDASAAAGFFRYHYVNAAGKGVIGQLVNPRNDECILIPQTAAGKPPVDGPQNITDRPVKLYLDDECDGPSTELKAFEKRGADRSLKFRAVLFIEATD